MSDDERDQRNVVLVTVDSLRADHCGYWGYDRETSPTLDRMAEEGFVFEQAFAPGPSTYESMPAIFTGRHMTSFSPNVESSDGDEDAIDARTRNIRMNMNAPTIPEWFAEQGYATGAFTTNPYTGAHTGFARGFDHYEDFMGDGEGPLMRKAAHLPVLSEIKHVITLLRGDRASKQWTEYYDRIIEWVEDVDDPYFLWVFLLDTHTPYLADSEHRAETDVSHLEMYYHNWRLWMEKKWRADENHSSLDQETLVDLYDATIASVDDFLSSLLEDLGDTDPIVVVHSDHGEAFGEHGTYGHDAQLYEENLHVPLIVHGNGLTGRTTTPVSLTQLPELLQHLATGAEQLSTVNQPGTVLSKTFDAEQFCLRGPDWKYVCRTDPDEKTVQDDRLYDLRHDPDERDPIDKPESLAAACRQAIRRRLSHERELDVLADGVSAIRGEQS
ncbi:sulfatase [Halostella sp. JP-L12]|uniref:sulfatase n=1 Tax=Halostella TaxID=1843185 RepID=UPI000EF75B9A|nr:MULTISPECIES: sulfatase [Halostella]NHN46551.1 sulfatase [Halostella sp. JP-L12]